LKISPVSPPNSASFTALFW